MTMPLEDDFTELVDADIPRVDLVDKAANGMRFLIAKQDGHAGLMDPDLIRDLLAKSDPEPTSEETVTMTGTPGAIANLIHQAAVRQVTKADDKKPAPKYKGLTQEAKDKYVSDLKDSSKNPTHDISSAIRRMSQYAGSGNLPHGITYDELKWMYNQAAAELHRRDPDSDAGGNFPALGSGVHKAEGDVEVAKCQAMSSAFASAAEEVGDDDVSKMVVDLAKVGPKGFEHGWIKVGAPGESEAHKHLAAAHQAIAEGKHALAVNHLTVAANHAQHPDAKKAITAMRNHLAGQLMGKPAKGKTKTKKAAEDGSEVDKDVDGMDPTVPLAAPEGDAPGDPHQPGSPSWEAIDAATARKWTSILVRAKNALGILADREMMEAACADPGDAEAAFDLRGAQCAIDCAVDILATFAVDEQAEVDLAADGAQAVAKALTGFDPAALDTLEVLAPVAKAGRTLSAANELAIRQAVEALTKVLASLPTAPQPDEADQPVAKKEETMLVDPTTPDTTDTAPVAKADEAPTPLVPVYDAMGKLVGVCDPGNMTPVKCPDMGDSGEADVPDDDGDADADNEVAAAAEEMADLDPAPPASVGTPADDVHDGVEKTTEPTDDSTEPAAGAVATASSIEDLVKQGIESYSATQQELITKQEGQLREMAETIEALKAQVRTLEEQPAEPKVFTNGAVPPARQLRGQDRGPAQQIDVAKAQELKKGLYGAADATEQNRIATDMQGLAIVALQDIHNRRVTQ